MHFGDDRRFIHRSFWVAQRISQFQTIYPRPEMGGIPCRNGRILGDTHLGAEIDQGGNCFLGEIFGLGIASIGHDRDRMLEREFGVELGHRIRPIAKSQRIGIAFDVKWSLQLPCLAQLHRRIDRRMRMATGRERLEVDSMDEPAIAIIGKRAGFLGHRLEQTLRTFKNRSRPGNAVPSQDARIATRSNRVKHMPLLREYVVMSHVPKPTGHRCAISHR